MYPLKRETHLSKGGVLGVTLSSIFKSAMECEGLLQFHGKPNSNEEDRELGMYDDIKMYIRFGRGGINSCIIVPLLFSLDRCFARENKRKEKSRKKSDKKRGEKAYKNGTF